MKYWCMTAQWTHIYIDSQFEMYIELIQEYEKAKKTLSWVGKYWSLLCAYLLASVGSLWTCESGHQHDVDWRSVVRCHGYGCSKYCQNTYFHWSLLLVTASQATQSIKIYWQFIRPFHDYTSSSRLHIFFLQHHTILIMYI